MHSLNAANPAVDLAPFGRWTLRDEAPQRRLFSVEAMSPLFKSSNVLFLLLVGIAANVGAQEPDPLTKFIQDMAQMHQAKTMCLDSSSSPAVRANIITYLKTMGEQNSATAQTLAVSMWTLYPCPFSPFRPELRPATEKDIEGVWLFPESSQKLRFPPKSGRQGPAGPMPVRCDAVGYYSNGELRHAVIAGQAACPFGKAADLDVARKNPIVSTWRLYRPGRIAVTRTDVANHIEEWDVFFVVTPFTFSDVQFAEGDLVAYVRKENGNDVGAATQFRHLKRLP
ncbi:hypothetical protein [Azonexus hydrophilus]|uniref:Uncharacterized protein n=1 Tax=Azonexus hydrophilus TaxID=418702 RepID=A0ABZ2XET2_9RHOO|nr:hypothetical protein [Azonexus hydrophilus]